jgi:hypothetical protein
MPFRPLRGQKCCAECRDEAENQDGGGAQGRRHAVQALLAGEDTARLMQWQTQAP